MVQRNKCGYRSGRIIKRSVCGSDVFYWFFTFYSAEGAFKEIGNKVKRGFNNVPRLE